MAHPKTLKVEKIIDLGFDSESGDKLYQGLSIYKVHIDALREQDKNARVMTPEKFNRLADNIKLDKRLESLPYVVKTKAPDGSEQFQIISGHHRIRTSRKAGMTEVIVLVEENELTRDQVVSKQLAHNALTGHDDPDILRDLYLEIASIDEKIKTGLTDQELMLDSESLKIDELDLEIDYENIQILFLASQFKKWDKLLPVIDTDPRTNVYVADRQDFDSLKTTIQEISKRENVRNISAIIARMVDICEEYYIQKEPNQ